MRSKLPEVVRFTARLRLLPGPLTSRILIGLLVLGLFVCCPSVTAQILGRQKSDGSIVGTVYSQGDKRPAGQVAVSLRSHEAGIVRSVLTDSEGHFEVRGLPPSQYEISIEEAGFEPLRSSAQLDGDFLNLEFHLVSRSPETPPSAPTVSVRELTIPGKAQHEYKKGLQCLQKQDLAGSLDHFTKAVEVFPGYYEAMYHQGVVHTNLGQFGKAFEAFQRSVETSAGRYAKAVLGVGYVLYLEGKAIEAEPIIRRGLEIDPNSSDGYVMLGMALLRLNRNEEAEKSAREALLRNPNQANAYLVLADSFARRQNYREQVQDLDSYLKLDPNGSASKRAQEVRAVAMKLLNRMQPQDGADDRGAGSPQD